MTEDMLTSGQAADFLGVSQSTIQRLVIDGQLFPDWETPGGHMRFLRETLDAFRNDRAVVIPPPAELYADGALAYVSADRLSAHRTALAALVDEADLTASRLEDVAKVIREHGAYDNSGFCEASAGRLRAALAAGKRVLNDE